MAVQRKKAASAVEAPAEPTPAAMPHRRKTVVSVGLTPEMLARVDEWAQRHGMSRAAAISYAISNLE